MSMKCAVIGLGEFGRSAAINLAKSGMDVIAVDAKMEKVEAIKNQVSLAICMDGSHEFALQTHGLADVEVLIAAIGNNFEAQVLVVLRAKELGIKKIVARATTPDHKRVLKAVGADEVLNPEEEAAHWTVKRILVRDISNYFELADGFSVAEVKAPDGVVGMQLRQLNLRSRFRLNLIAHKRMKTTAEGEVVLAHFDPVPDPETVIREGDVLALVGSVLDLGHFMGSYSS